MKKELEAEIKEVEKKYERKDLLAMLGSIFFASFGIMSLFGLPIQGLAMICISLGLVKTKSEISKRKQITESRLNRELDHIKKVEAEGLNASPELNAKRKDKLVNLALAARKNNKKLKDVKTSNNFALLGLGLSAVFSAIIPPIGLVSSAIFTIAKAYTESKLTSVKEEHDNLMNRINNIHNDLKIIESMPSSSNARKKAVTTASPSIKKKTVPRSVPKQQQFSKNESIVQQYIDMMEKQSKVQTAEKGTTKYKKY